MSCLDIEHLKADAFAFKTGIFSVFPGVCECNLLMSDALLAVAIKPL
jgi:hypothetical protein